MALRLGRYTLEEVPAGAFALDGGVVFGVVPKVLWAEELAADETNRVRLVARSLLISTGERRILVDAGPGPRWGERPRRIYGIEPEPDVVQGLAALGVAPEDVTDVVVTHLHWDHVGGLTREDEAGRLHLTFPRAAHHIQRRNWKWAHTPSERDRKSYRPEDFAVLEESGRVHFVEGETELLDGVQLLTCEGHTVGQQILRVTCEEGTVLFCGDTIPTAAHVRIPWAMGYDLYPLTMIEEKKQLLAQALEEGWILFFEHDPRFAACTVREDGSRVVVDRVVSFA